MFSFLKRFMKAGVIATVVLGTAATAAVVVAGPGRARAVFSQVHGKLLHSIDATIDDPVALRAQLQEMEREYPQRIAQVRGDLAELNEEIRQLERDQAIATRVVELAEQDLVAMQGQVDAAAEDELGRARLASVTIDHRVYTLERAAARMQQIHNTRVAYANRASDAEHDLKYLRQQSGRLETLLVQLEKERAEFRGQIVGLSRQVDAIARNERLIDLLEKRNRTIEECTRFEAISLDQITGRLAEIRSRQEAELDLLASTQAESDYEDLARMQLDSERLDQDEAAQAADAGYALTYPTSTND